MPYKGEILAFSSAVLWGLAVVLFKKSGEKVHPIALNIFKNTLALILFIPTMLIAGIEIFPQVPTAHYLILVLSGLIGITLGDTLFLKSLNLLGAGLTGIVYCLYSPFVIGLSFLILGETLSIFQGLGVLLIVMAVLISTYRDSNVKINKKDLILGILIAVLANVSFAFGVVLIKPLLQDYSVLWVTEVRLAGGIFGLFLVMTVHPARKSIMSTLYSRSNWLYTLIGSFTGTYLAMVMWVGGIKYTLASIASALNQTNTIFIFIFAALILREPVTRRRIIALILAVSGALTVSLF